MINVAHGLMVLAIFTGACAIGVQESLGRLTRPAAAIVLAAAIGAYIVAAFGG